MRAASGKLKLASCLAAGAICAAAQAGGSIDDLLLRLDQTAALYSQAALSFSCNDSYDFMRGLKGFNRATRTIMRVRQIYSAYRFYGVEATPVLEPAAEEQHSIRAGIRDVFETR